MDKCAFGEILSLSLSISGFSFRFCVYYQRPIIKNVDDIINWYRSVIDPFVLIVGDFNLPDVDWHSLSVKKKRVIHICTVHF